MGFRVYVEREEKSHSPTLVSTLGMWTLPPAGLRVHFLLPPPPPDRVTKVLLVVLWVLSEVEVALGIHSWADVCVPKGVRAGAIGVPLNGSVGHRWWVTGMRLWVAAYLHMRWEMGGGAGRWISEA